MGFFRRSYDLGRRVLPWVVAGAAIFGAYKYSQYKTEKERTLISRLGRLEDDNATLRGDYLERKKDEADHRERVAEMRREAKEASDELKTAYSETLRRLREAGEKDREQILRETAEARREFQRLEKAVGDQKRLVLLEGEKVKADLARETASIKTEAERARKELTEALWPKIEPKPETKEKPVLSDKELLKKEIEIIDLLKDNPVVINYGKPEDDGEFTEIVAPVRTILGNGAAHLIVLDRYTYDVEKEIGNSGRWQKATDTNSTRILILTAEPKSGDFRTYAKRDYELPHGKQLDSIFKAARRKSKLVLVDYGGLNGSVDSAFKNGFEWEFPYGSDRQAEFGAWLDLYAESLRNKYEWVVDKGSVAPVVSQGKPSERRSGTGSKRSGK